MVHRPPDSRLLNNLIQHEKECTRHLAALFPLSHAALASLSAYAAASPSSHPASPAHTIAAVVDVLASADDALQRYTHAIDVWRGQLVGLKDLEDDLAGVLRDRDIFVTRLIKASKSTRDSHRSSRLVNLGSASLSSLPSTNSTTFSSTGSSPASTNAKLAQAQAELQACEAHLVAKERELDARRITLARNDLGARCRALIDCGWVWCEMGKQGLRALQALNADGSGSSQADSKPSLAVPPHLSTNPAPYTSDNSSLTPSQSASQIAARSVETSPEDPTSKEHEHAHPETAPVPPSKPQARPTPTNVDEDVTITLPPAHAISELAFPTSVRAQNGDLTATANADTAPAPRRKRIKRPHRPPSQHITEASDEGSDASPSASRTANTNADVSPLVSQTPFPTAHAPETHDTSSDDEPIGPLQVVENDPFEVIRQSMLGPAATSPLLASTTPTARASAPDVRTSIVMETSQSRIAFLGPVSSSTHGHRTGIGTGALSSTSPTKRQRRPSMAFFGSLRGLFRKPKERERLGIAWDDPVSPSPASPSQRTRKSGWVTRTDARIKARGGQDSDEEAIPKGTRTQANNVTNVVGVGRSTSRARLRKGRPARENGPSRVPSHRATIDGWITDTPAGQGAVMDANGAGAVPGGSRTRRGTVKQKRTSVADLRGSEQGHTDGEADRGRPSLQHMSSMSKGKAPEASVIEVEEEKELAVPTETSSAAIPSSNATVDPNASISASSQHRRAATTAATSSRKPSSDTRPAYHRSASLSLMDTHVMIVSTSTSQSTTQSMSWRKPPPPIEPPSQPTSPPPTASLSRSSSLSQSQTQTQAQAQTQAQTSRTHESQPKPNARRHLGNGHGKHVQNQSLMSIVADVTRQSLDRDREGDEERERPRVTDKARSLDIPRAPGSVLSETDRVRGEVGGVNGRGHARATSEDVRSAGGGQVGQGQGQGQQRAIKMPLRSALRNASRTPSPSPSPAIVPTKEANKQRAEGERGRAVSRVPSWRDSVSVSSYETGRESLDGQGAALPTLPERSPSPSPARSPPLHSPPRSLVVRSQSQPPAARSPSPMSPTRTHTPSPSPPPLPSFTFPPPPVDPPPVRSGTTTFNSNPNPDAAHANGNGNEPPSSRTSTETPPANVQRRKSVRVSLQPTFSPPPPAVYDEDVEGYVPRSGSRHEGSRDRTQDVWADSSEEDEEYSRARRLLSLAGRGKA